MTNLLAVDFDFTGLIGEYAFPIAVTWFLLIRMERVISELTQAIRGLATNSVGLQKDVTEIKEPIRSITENIAIIRKDKSNAEIHDKIVVLEKNLEHVINITTEIRKSQKQFVDYLALGDKKQ